MSHYKRIIAIIIFIAMLTISWDTLIYAAGDDPWGNANSYMENELREASQLGLIPDIMSDTDFTKPITRAEFAHLIVTMLEEYTDVQTQPVMFIEPFSDSDDPVVFKAFGFGIMDRTNDEEALFSPDGTVNREAMADMLYRATHIIAPLADYSVPETPSIPDLDLISQWARQAVIYFYGCGIVTGGGNSVFMPRPVTDEQRASNYGVATREQCVVFAQRVFNELPQIENTRFSVDDKAADVLSYAMDEPQGGVDIDRDELINLLRPFANKVRWGNNMVSLSFIGDLRKVGDDDWIHGYDSAFLYNAFTAIGENQYKLDEEQQLWGGLSGWSRYALTAFDAGVGIRTTHEWNSTSDTGTLYTITTDSFNMFSPMSLRNYMPGRLDWEYKLYDDVVINGERCIVFSTTRKDSLIQEDAPPSIDGRLFPPSQQDTARDTPPGRPPTMDVDVVEYHFISTVSGLRVFFSNYSTVRETTYLAFQIIFGIFPSLTDASQIEPPSDIVFSPPNFQQLPA